MSQFPSMPLYCADLLADTSHLEPEVFAAYTRILYTMWLADGSVPDDDKFLARAGCISVRKWRMLRPQVMVFLMPFGEGRLTQKKLMKTRRNLVEKSTKNKDAANVRWAKQRAYPSNSGRSAHANAYANADANAYPTRARLQNYNNNPSTSQPLPDEARPSADAAGADPTGPPSLPVSDKLLNTKIVKKGH